MPFVRICMALACCSSLLAAAVLLAAESERFVRYADDSGVSYGVVEGERIHQLTGPPYDGVRRTGRTVAASKVTLLAPAEPSKVIAIGFNYVSHLNDRPLPAEMPVFLKLPSSIIGPGADIVYPEGATEVHFEGELVVVIGKVASRVSMEDAGNYIFGVTAGNDVSERNWQANDLQWFRGKASDTFGPVGPAIVTGLDYRDLEVQTRLNGEVMQKQRTSDHIRDIHDIVSYLSTYTTLYPGDLIFTGTPGQTSAMQPGDTVEIEVEGVGVLQNRIGTPAGEQ